MTIESYLSRIADALEAIATRLPTNPAQVPATVIKDSTYVPVNPAPAPAVPAPVVPAVSAASAPVAASPAPIPVHPAVPSGCPFTDTKGLITYVMDAYKSLGPTKGALIQNVLTKLGVNNINEVQPKDYQALWSGIEELKK